MAGQGNAGDDRDTEDSFIRRWLRTADEILRNGRNGKKGGEPQKRGDVRPDGEVARSGRPAPDA